MQLPKDGFHGIGAYIALIPAGKSRGLHSVQFCQAWRCYIESLPLVLKDKEAVSLKVNAPLYSCLLIVCLPSRNIL